MRCWGQLPAQRKQAEDAAAGHRCRLVVTVLCGYATRGYELAWLLASRLGVPWYYREILDKAARAMT
jgi:hypothetical protein